MTSRSCKEIVCRQPANSLPELPEEWKSGLSWDDRIKNRKDDFTDEERVAAWAQVDEAVKTVSDEMVRRWKDEMDTLLVYAGLFSALLTAFNIMVKQWLHEYSSGISGKARQTARLRQHRYNGLVRWKVAEIIAILPMLLQAALGLFLAGVLVLLWNLHRTVAITASILVGVLLIFTLATIVLPTLSSDCAYLSPLSVSLFYFSHPLRKLLRSTRTTLYQSLRSVLDPASFNASFVGRVKRWCYDACTEPASMEPEGSPAPTIYTLQSYVVTANPVALDQDILVTAYSTTRDIGLLDYASTCFSDHDLNELCAILARIHSQNQQFGQLRNVRASSQWTRFIPLDMVSDMLLLDAGKEAHLWRADEDISDWVEQYTLYHCQERAISNGPRSSYVLANTTVALYRDCGPDTAACLSVLRSQLDALAREDFVLPEQVLKRVIAAIHAVLRNGDRNIDVLGLCHLVLESCDQQRSQLGDRTPLADAIAFVEDQLAGELRRYIQQFGKYPDFSSLDGTLARFLAIYEDMPYEPLTKSPDVIVNGFLDLTEIMPEDAVDMWGLDALRKRLVSIRKERDSAT